MIRTLAALLLAGAALPAAAETVAITNARIETAGPKGVIPSGTLVIQDGRILAVGAAVQPPAGARVIDAKGGVLAPGFISPSSNLTVDEVNLISQTRDDGSGDRLGAAFDIAGGVNPNSSLVGVARLTGVTRAVITPILGKASPFEDEEGGAVEAASVQGEGDGASGRDPNLFSGQPAAIRLDDGDTAPVVKAHLAVAVAFGENASARAGSRGAGVTLVRAALDEARRFAADPDAYQRSPGAFGLSRLDLEALVPVVRGSMPLLARVSRAADIREVLKLAEAEKVHVILDGAEEGWMVAAEIARAGVGVVLDPETDLPDSFETLGARQDNATRLQAAGVLIAIKGSQNFNSLRPMRLNAGEAVAHGLPRDAAMAAVTLNPARIWGFADRVGSLEPGKDADVVLWSGDPLETTSFPTAIFIAGKPQPLTSRRLALRDRYLAPDDGWPAAYH